MARDCVAGEPPRGAAASRHAATAENRPLSELLGEFYQKLLRLQRKPKTVEGYRQAIWQFVEFVGCDPPRSELHETMPAQFLEWLRDTPWAPRKPGTLPKEITPATVSAFLRTPPPRNHQRGQRQEQSIGRIWRHLSPVLRHLGLPTRFGGADDPLPASNRPNLQLAPVWSPDRKQIGAWWAYCLADNGRPGRPRLAIRKRLVLLQALVFLTGMRRFELLGAGLADLEGHYLLLRKAKRDRPRVIYVNSLALGVAAALRRFHEKQDRRIPDIQTDTHEQALLFDEQPQDDGDERFCGWPYSDAHFGRLLTRSMAGYTGFCPKKPCQALRLNLSSYMLTNHPLKNGRVIYANVMAESVQLGHGQKQATAAGQGGVAAPVASVVLNHYLGVLQQLPRQLEHRRLPAIAAWPEPIKVPVAHPARIYEEFGKLIKRRGGGRS